MATGQLFPGGQRRLEGGIPVVGLAELRTVEDADAAWSRVQRIVSESVAERRLSLPVGQP